MKFLNIRQYSQAYGMSEEEVLAALARGEIERATGPDGNLWLVDDDDSHDDDSHDDDDDC